MPAARLTTARIAALEPRAAPYDARDAEITGLVVRTHPSGAKSFNLRYRLRNGRHRTMKLGPVSLGIGPARKLALQALAEVAAGGDPAGARRRARDAEKAEQGVVRQLGAYLDVYARHALAEQKRGAETIARLRTAFAGSLVLDLDQITAKRVQDWRAARLKACIAPATIDREVGMLRALLNHAVRVSGILSANPLAGLKPLVKAAARTNTLRYLSADEELRLRSGLRDRDCAMRAARGRANAGCKRHGRPVLPDYPEHFVDHLEPIVLVLLNTGLRFGELAQMKWMAIDFRTKLLTVHGDTAKSGISRHIPMTGEVASILSRWRTQSPLSALVFPGRVGVLTDIKSAWKPLLRRVRIERFRTHDLRHSYASKLVQRGVDLYRVQQLLGHASPTMTQRYAHLAPDHLADAVAVLERNIG
jgi:integrase